MTKVDYLPRGPFTIIFNDYLCRFVDLAKKAGDSADGS